MKHDEVKAKLLSNAQTASAYEGMGAKFERLRQMLKGRNSAGLTQAQVAERIRFPEADNDAA